MERCVLLGRSFKDARLTVSKRTAYLISFRLLCTTKATASKPHYTTTPIFYVNAAPHIGHLQSIVLADVFSRWAQWRNLGWSGAPNRTDLRKTTAVLATGTDEHGIKIQKVAEGSEESPRDLCDRVSHRFRALAQEAGVAYTRFIRTTDKDHIEAVRQFWTQLEQRGYIYKGTHEGWYSVSDEAFYTDLQISPSGEDVTKMVSIETGSVVEWSSETNYKFKLSAFQQPLLDWLESHPDAVVPASRRNNLVAELQKGLSDLSISRPRSRLHWGIPVPSDEEHTIYVWLDALTNYLTVAGYPWKNPSSSTGCWPSDAQVIGMDILRFHAVYFPAFLMALDLPLPRHTVTHGHWTMNKSKMSKSRGNVADPFLAIKTYGKDALRWFLCYRGGNLGSDADWTEPIVLENYRKQLQGQFGNQVSRVMAPKILSRLFEAPTSSTVTLGTPNFIEEQDGHLIRTLEHLAIKVEGHMSQFEVNQAWITISEALAQTNEHFQRLEPWNANVSVDVVHRAVYLARESCRICALLAMPIMPDKMQELLSIIQDADGQEWSDALHLRNSFTLHRAGKAQILFPEITVPEAV